MTNSPFIEGFTLFELEFGVPRQDDGAADDNEFGNPDLTPPSETDPVNVTVTLRTTSDPKVLNLVGADATKVALKGRCVDPMTLPSGIVPGASCALEMNGVIGRFTLGPTWPSSVPAVEEALGQQIVGTWTSGSP